MRNIFLLAITVSFASACAVGVRREPRPTHRPGNYTCDGRGNSRRPFGRFVAFEWIV